MEGDTLGREEVKAGADDMEMEGDTLGREEVKAGADDVIGFMLGREEVEAGADDIIINDSNKTVDDDKVDKVKLSKKMPKRRKIYGRSMKRGGNRKLGHAGDGIEYVPPIAPTRFAVALEPDTRMTPITPSNQINYIRKKTLFRQLQQMEVNIL
jgi:hypothetical protein